MPNTIHSYIVHMLGHEVSSISLVFHSCMPEL